jgi:hypothetical protein
MKGHSCVAIKKDGTKAGRFKSPKAKGRHLLRDIALSIRFIKDLVRHPDRNSVDTVVVQVLRAEPALPSLLRYLRRKSFVTSIVPVAWHEFRCRFSSMSVVRSLLLEDRSSVEEIVPRKCRDNTALLK